MLVFVNFSTFLVKIVKKIEILPFRKRLSDLNCPWDYRSTSLGYNHSFWDIVEIVLKFFFIFNSNKKRMWKKRQAVTTNKETIYCNALKKSMAIQLNLTDF